MAQFSYEDYTKRQQAASNRGNGTYRVRFFSMPKPQMPGDVVTTIVRFDYDNPSEFLLLDVHTLPSSNNRFVKVNCLREAGESWDKCPFCSERMQRTSRFYAKVLQYTTQDGKIVAQPCAWDAPMSVVAQLNAIYHDYEPKPLRDIIFKISKSGEGRNVTYTVTAANPERYNPSVYVADFSGFEGFKFAGSSYLNKTFSEMNYYIDNGSFPETATRENPTPQQTIPTQPQKPLNSFEDFNTAIQDEEVVYSTPEHTTADTYSRTVPSNTATASQASETNRPRRTYTY